MVRYLLKKNDCPAKKEAGTKESEQPSLTPNYTWRADRRAKSKSRLGFKKDPKGILSDGEKRGLNLKGRGESTRSGRYAMSSLPLAKDAEAFGSKALKSISTRCFRDGRDRPQYAWGGKEGGGTKCS